MDSGRGASGLCLSSSSDTITLSLVTTTRSASATVFQTMAYDERCVLSPLFIAYTMTRFCREHTPDLSYYRSANSSCWTFRKQRCRSSTKLFTYETILLRKWTCVSRSCKLCAEQNRPFNLQFCLPCITSMYNPVNHTTLALTAKLVVFTNLWIDLNGLRSTKNK